MRERGRSESAVGQRTLPGLAERRFASLRCLAPLQLSMAKRTPAPHASRIGSRDLSPAGTRRRSVAAEPERIQHSRRSC